MFASSLLNLISSSLQGHESIVTSITGRDDILLTSGYEEKLFLWSLSSGQLMHSLTLKGCPKEICINDNKEIFVGGPLGSLIKIKFAS